MRWCIVQTRRHCRVSAWVMNDVAVPDGLHWLECRLVPDGLRRAACIGFNAKVCTVCQRFCFCVPKSLALCCIDRDAAGFEVLGDIEAFFDGVESCCPQPSVTVGQPWRAIQLASSPPSQIWSRGSEPAVRAACWAACTQGLAGSSRKGS